MTNVIGETAFRTYYSVSLTLSFSADKGSILIGMVLALFLHENTIFILETFNNKLNPKKFTPSIFDIIEQLVLIIDNLKK
jgi:hypothetical protein